MDLQNSNEINCCKKRIPQNKENTLRQYQNLLAIPFIGLKVNSALSVICGLSESVPGFFSVTSDGFLFVIMDCGIPRTFKGTKIIDRQSRIRKSQQNSSCCWKSKQMSSVINKGSK